MEIVVLRYGHRIIRDERVTSHCCLAARALGAKKIIIEGSEDKTLTEVIESMSKKWGSGFKVEFTDSWRKTLAEYKKKGYTSVHLTMYGGEAERFIGEIRKKEKILAIIGSQKVERDVYEKSDYNISITQQPHSEISALAVFLYMLTSGKTGLKKAQLSIVPDVKGRKIVKNTKK